MPDPFAVAALKASQAKIGGDIVTQTLDTLNSGQFSGSKNKSCDKSSGMSNTYNLSKSVLSAAYEGKGIAVRTIG